MNSRDQESTRVARAKTIAKEERVRSRRRQNFSEESRQVDVRREEGEEIIVKKAGKQSETELE